MDFSLRRKVEPLFFTQVSFFSLTSVIRCYRVFTATAEPGCEIPSWLRKGESWLSVDERIRIELAEVYTEFIHSSRLFITSRNLYLIIP